MKNRFPLICFHICSSDLFIITPVNLQINLELRQTNEQFPYSFRYQPNTKFYQNYIQKPRKKNNSQKLNWKILPIKRVWLEHIERGFVLSQSEVNKADTTPFALSIGVLGMSRQLMAGLYAFKSTIFEGLVSGCTQKVIAFLPGSSAIVGWFLLCCGRHFSCSSLSLSRRSSG